jgi:hypothetical protein
MGSKIVLGVVVPDDVEVYLDMGACWCEPNGPCSWCETKGRHRHLVDERCRVTNQIQMVHRKEVRDD